MQSVTDYLSPIGGYTGTRTLEYSPDYTVLPSITSAIQAPTFNAPSWLNTGYVPAGYTASSSVPVTGVTTDVAASIPTQAVTPTPVGWYDRFKQIPLVSNVLNVGKRWLGTGKQEAAEVAEAGKRQWSNLSNTQRASTVADGLNAVSNAWNNYKLNKLQKQQFEMQRDYLQKNYANEVRKINSQLYDRQARRAAEQPHANMSVAEYMDKYGAR